MKRLLVPVLLVVFWAPSTAVCQAVVSSGLTRLIEAEVGRFPAKVGVYVEHTVTGERAGVLADEPFNTMSVIKVPLMALAYQMAERGEIDLDERIDIREEDLRPGSGMLYLFDLGLAVSVRDLILQMIITSDNTATDLVLAQVGGIDKLNGWLEAQGYEETRMLATLSEWFRRFYSYPLPELADVSTTELFAIAIGQRLLPESRYGAYAERARQTLGSLSPEQRSQWLDASWRERELWLGSTTPREMGRLLVALQAGRLASEEHSEDMRRVMLRQRVGQRRISDVLTGYPVAHKTGDNAPHIANNVGIVFRSLSTPMRQLVFDN